MVRHPLFGAASFGAIAQPLSFATATATTATTNAATNTSATTPAAPAALNPRRPTDPLQAGGRERPSIRQECVNIRQVLHSFTNIFQQAYT